VEVLGLADPRLNIDYTMLFRLQSLALLRCGITPFKPDPQASAISMMSWMVSPPHKLS
jgi:hypothetical protein